MRPLRYSLVMLLSTAALLALVLAGCADRSGAQALGERFVRAQLSETVLTLTATKTNDGWRFGKGFQARTRIPEIRRQPESTEGS
jgi:hypothetical protein